MLTELARSPSAVTLRPMSGKKHPIDQELKKAIQKEMERLELESEKEIQLSKKKSGLKRYGRFLRLIKQLFD